MKNREELLQNLNSHKSWDILVIGGGATGLGIAVDAATRGYKTLLLEQHDFAKSTSSRSTKLVHGGVRYLAQGDVGMVIEALHERGRMKRNAPHLVKDMRFIIGGYRWWENIFYGVGLTLYDILAGRLGLGRSLILTKSRVLNELPKLKKEGLRGGVVYHDGQFDDARMAVTLAQTANDYNATCLNYIKVAELIKNEEGKLCGVIAIDTLTGEKHQIEAKTIINATGVFVDDILCQDEPNSKKKVRPSQGVHLVVDNKFLGGNSALMIPKTKDGRVLFCVPWHNKVVVGTTDTPLNHSSLEPKALEEEIDFILDQAGQYLAMQPTRKDVLSVFAGLRPLAAPNSDSDAKKTKEISRSHKMYLSQSNLITITGGKWTTYRAMAEEVVNKAITVGKLPEAKCRTKNLKLHGYQKTENHTQWDYVYGSDAEQIHKLYQANPSYKELLHPNYTFTVGHVIWAVRRELAQTVEDVLARRVRVLFMDARTAIEIAPKVATIMAQEMSKDEHWIQQQTKEFTEIANGYLL